MKKIKASLNHFLMSTIIFLPVLYIIYFRWYPYPLLEMQGGVQVLLLLTISTLIIGPLLTLIVYKPAKKGLLLDFFVIIVIQIMALLYGVYVLYQERPQYIAFNVDRFSLISAANININELQDKSLKTSVFDRPQFVYTELPGDSDKRMQITLEAVAGGKDFILRPEYYRDYQMYSAMITTDSRQLSLKKLLHSYPDAAKQIAAIRNKNNLSLNELVFYPIQGKHNDRIIVLTGENARQVGILNIDPWRIKG